MHQFLMVVINNAIINAKLYREVYIKENIDYPLQGWGSKNLDCAIFAQNPEKDLKDLWPCFIFKITFADSDATQDPTSTKHRDMEPFQLYAKLPHPPNMKGKWILSEGEQADIGDDVKANIGKKFQTYQDTNSLSVRYYADAVLIDAGVMWLSRTFQIDKNSLSPEYDVIINSKVMVRPDREPFRLPAKAIWVEVCHQHWIHEMQKHPRSEEHDFSFIVIFGTNFMQAVQK
ncbi:hypothetical protein ARMGADRAFT_1038430 [Armillaria gallica]|uniref:Uncharacterized protein n=1 Tax=Armillaria gallica TaxID=47427 RepID=A0A2H3D0U4_ARMGA|nr:hypothetical protein ARMGADRAFT_1038430 [Armillaria gallica]